MSQETTAGEAFADRTPLVHLLGPPARTRMLAVFVDERDFDLSVTEIAAQAGIARSTVYDHLDPLLALGVIEETRQTGGGTRYQLAADDRIAELLYELDGVVLQRLLDAED